jgi:hypothetical protein
MTRRARYDGYADWYEDWSGGIVQGDAAVLPFADRTFPTVATIWISTDVDDFGAVLREASRVLVPGGLFVFYGAHPCFNGPHVQWMDDGGVHAHPAYRHAGWHAEAPDRLRNDPAERGRGTGPAAGGASAR